MAENKKLRFSLSTNILIGMFLGIACGIFFGEKVAFLQVAGNAFIKLLQMTILPYILVSLVNGIGGLTYNQAKELAKKGGLLLLLFWAIAFAMILLIPLSFPTWESSAFFSTSLVETPPKVDFLSLYIPSNPFYSMANNIVPAVVLFSILLGVALMGIKDKEVLLKSLATASEALVKITGIIVKLTPLGVFAISAAAAGTMTIEYLGRLQVYLISFNLAVLLLTFGILPLLLIPVTHKIPLAYPIAAGDLVLADLINKWIYLAKDSPSFKRKYDYWIMGVGAEEKKPRWSVLRDVLGWGFDEEEKKKKKEEEEEEESTAESKP